MQSFSNDYDVTREAIFPFLGSVPMSQISFSIFSFSHSHSRYCGYIIDSGERGGQKHYKFHGFRKEPNTDSLCLALHLACQARYQRVLNANPAAAKKLEDSMVCASCQLHVCSPIPTLWLVPFPHPGNETSCQLVPFPHPGSETS